MMLDIWTFLWLLVCLTILISILESVYRRMKENQLRQQEIDLQRQLQAQQYHVFTLQPLRNPMPSCTSLTQQEQQYIHQQQELKASEDLPPKYEDVVNGPFPGMSYDLSPPSTSPPPVPQVHGASSTGESTSGTQPVRY